MEYGLAILVCQVKKDGRLGRASSRQLPGKYQQQLPISGAHFLDVALEIRYQLSFDAATRRDGYTVLHWLLTIRQKDLVERDVQRSCVLFQRLD